MLGLVGVDVLALWEKTVLALLMYTILGYLTQWNLWSSKVAGLGFDESPSETEETSSYLL